MDAQTRLLRVLQSGEFTTVGGTRTLRADVRIVSATNKDLRRLIDTGQFREDLFYRLNVVPVRLPPLRARIDDIAELARHFLVRAAAEGLPRKHLDGGAVEALHRYGWPGNVRELENLMRRLAALTRGETIGAAAVDEGLREGQPPRGAAIADTSDSLAGSVEMHIARYFAVFGDDLPPDGLYDRILAEVERPLLMLCLAATRGNQIQAAKLLGINRNTLRKKLTERGVDPGGLKRG
jgi:two-component system nitrogen regulation response regulator GlnG